MINEAEKLDSIFNKVKTFVNFAKNAKTENEKEQLMSDAGDIKKEIQNSNVDNNLTQILLSTIVAAVLFLNTSGNAKESPNTLKSSSKFVDDTKNSTRVGVLFLYGAEKRISAFSGAPRSTIINRCLCR